MSEEFTPNAEIWSLFDAACGDALDADQVERLEAALRGDERLRDLYLDYFRLHAELLRTVRLERARENVIKSMRQPVPPAAQPIVLDLSSPLSSPLSPLPSFVGGPVFSYMVATVFLGLMLLGAWAYTVTHYQQIVDNSSSHRSVQFEPELVFVGRVTGMKGCLWSDPSTQTYVGASVPLGRKYALSAGLMELTYICGAKVILEGPCTYKVESDAGGYLALGKLTARVEKKGSGARGQGSGSEATPSSFIPHPSSFVVKTPTAIVTDLGTEFGVEVGEEGNTTSCVFRGSVKVQTVGDNGLPSLSGRGAGGEGSVVLRANESARVEKDHKSGGSRIVTGRAVGAAPKFARRVYEPPKYLDLLDIVAGGNGLGHRRECGIDPSSGMQDTLFVARTRRGDGQFHLVEWNGLVDGVFVPNGSAGPVKLDSGGQAYDGFPRTAGLTFGSIWSRAAGVERPEWAHDVSHWVYSMGPGKQFMPEGHGLLAVHANAGITFDLQAIRQRYRGARLIRFHAVVGMADAARLLPGVAGMAEIWILTDGRLKYKLPHLTVKNGTVEINVGLGPQDRFLTLAVTDAFSGHAYDWVVFGDPVLQMKSTESEAK